MTHKTSQDAELSSHLQTPLSNHLFHITTWKDNGHLKSNMFKPNPVLPISVNGKSILSLLRPNNLESSLIPVFLSQWNIILQEILLCLQNTSVYNNISPLPPWSNPIISHLNYCKSHTAGPPFFGHWVPGVYSQHRRQVILKNGKSGHVSHVLKPCHWLPTSLKSKSLWWLIRFPIICSSLYCLVLRDIWF